jgi:hypothetical protein
MEWYEVYEPEDIRPETLRNQPVRLGDILAGIQIKSTADLLLERFSFYDGKNLRATPRQRGVDLSLDVHSLDNN